MQVPYDLLEKFNIKGAINSIAPLGFGHINDSFSIQVESDHFLLQRLNTDVFKDPEVVENNLYRILEQDQSLFPEHIRGRDHKIHQVKDGKYWRMQEFVLDSYSPTELTISELKGIATGFGKFTKSSAQAKVMNYSEAIPRFHSLELRLDQLEAAIKNDSAIRADQIKVEIEAIQNYRWILEKFQELSRKGLPIRVCHNDAKAGNCLLSKRTGNFLKIVDLDTVGPGYVMFDLGDMLRSMLFNIPENQADLDGLSIDKKRFECILNHFLAECSDSISELEVDSLAFGGLYMTYIMAVRFLTDYLNGDIYYKTSSPEENLIRTRNQLKILDLMVEFIPA